jgi:hypothetical protein
MRNALRSIRETFHPLFYLRKFTFARWAIAGLDFPVFLRIPKVNFLVRGLLITHGLAYSATGSQEPNPEAIFEACLGVLPIRSFWEVGANIGFYTWLVKTKSPNVEVLMFEPLPMNAALIADTLGRNRLTGVELRGVAVSDRECGLIPNARVQAVAAPAPLVGIRDMRFCTARGTDFCKSWKH